MKTESFIVERVSEGLYIFEREDKSKLILPIAEVNIACMPGDVITLKDGVFLREKVKTEIRRERLQQKTRNLFKNNT